MRSLSLRRWRTNPNSAAIDVLRVRTCPVVMGLLYVLYVVSCSLYFSCPFYVLFVAIYRVGLSGWGVGRGAWGVGRIYITYEYL